MITSWNNGAQRLFGYEEKEMIGQPILRLIPENLHYEEEEILRKLRAGENIEHYETTRIGKSGEIREVSVTISPIRNNKGEIIGASKIARDISNRKKLERLAVEAEKIATTGRMAAAVAHEINNPLGSVLNLIYLSRQDGVSSEEIQNYLATAESELERVSHIARQTLGYYRDTGSPSDVHLRALVEDVLSVYSRKLRAQNIVVETRFNFLRNIRARPGEIIQIFSNLVSNAIHAMPHGGTLTISTAQDLNSDPIGVQICVSDTGHGIRREDLGKIFEPFFTTKGNLGTGIGLWVAKQLVERHGGKISVFTSTEPGNSGTTLAINLPFSGSETKTKKANGSESRTEIQ